MKNNLPSNLGASRSAAGTAARWFREHLPGLQPAHGNPVPGGRQRVAVRQSGVALVATLIMLSLVTFMVVAFLGVARRERASVAVAFSQNESRTAMETALARVQADLMTRLTVDKWNYGLLVATNYENNTFNAGVSSPTNVLSALANNTYFANPTPANLANYFLQNLANLQYDPRPPVFAPYFTNWSPFATLFSETNLGRFYLDLNRNQMFEFTSQLLAGDPQWIGVLEYPNIPHNGTNRFLSRYTYLLAPAGKAMDLNVIHNGAKWLAAPVPPGNFTNDGYVRNLSLGPAEMNLAALLREANPLWTYFYDATKTVSQTSVTTNLAFVDAASLLQWRYNTGYTNLTNLAGTFGATPATFLTNALFDVLGDGLLGVGALMSSTALQSDRNSTAVPWPGGSNVNPLAQGFHDFTDLFQLTRNYARFATNLLLSATNTNNTVLADHERRTPYRLMSVLGVDSWPQTGKLNINWPNNPVGGSPGGETFGFTNWAADSFFFSAAELMLRASCAPVVAHNPNWTGYGGAETNVLNTNHLFGGGFNFNFVNTYYTNTVPATTLSLFWPGYGFIATNYGFVVETNRTLGGGISLSVTNIPIHPLSYYSPEVHRLLQLAANIYDAAGPPEWLASVTYSPGDRVQRGGVNYVARGTTTGSLPPSVNWEAINSAFLPTVWRPVFAFGDTNGWPSNDFIRIVGYTTNATHYSTNPAVAGLLDLPVVDLGNPNSRMQMYNTPGNLLGGSNYCLVAGTPVIIGARKGYPNFNEFGAQTLFSATRRLEFMKTNATNVGPLNLSAGRPLFQTNQSLVLGLTNIYGFEAWNSYAATFPRGLRLIATNVAQIVLTNQFGPVYTNTVTNGTNILITAGTWPGYPAPGSFKGFFFTNVPQLSTNLALGYAYATNYLPLPGFTNGGFVSASPTGPGSPSIFNRSNGFPEMRLGITITNSIRFALIAESNRVVDFVNLTNLVTGMDLATALRVTNSASANADQGVRFWFTNRVGGASVFNATLGISNQVAICLDTNINTAATNLWRQWSFNTPILREIDRFRRFMGTNGILPANQQLPLGVSVQSPFNPTRVVAFNTSWEANDPLVHHTTHDLSDPFRASLGDQVTPILPPATFAPPPGSLYSSNLVFVPGLGLQQRIYGGLNFLYQPWSRNLDTSHPRFQNLANQPNFYTVASPAFDQRLKDPGVFNSDQWDFPQRKFGNVGWLGRVHRGTPWQTFYLKSEVPNLTNWFYWARSVETSPTNDWRLLDVFSAAISAETTRGLLSVNQTNSAAWAAGLGSAIVLSNNGSFTVPLTVNPALALVSTQLTTLVGGATNGLIRAKMAVPMWDPVANYSSNDIVAYEVAPYFILGDPVPLTRRYYRAVNNTNHVQFPNIGRNPFLMTLPLFTHFTNYWTNVFPWVGTPTTYTTNDYVVYREVSYLSLSNGYSGALPDQFPSLWEPAPVRSFTRMGYVLRTPELSTQSPYLNVGRPWVGLRAYVAGERVYWQGWYYQATRSMPAGSAPPDVRVNYTQRRPNGFPVFNPATVVPAWWPLESAGNALFYPDALSDAFIERIPQQTLGLLHLESSPRVVIYAYGQSLRPAERGIYVGGGPFQGMVTNYQITGEVASRTVLRIDGLPDPGLLPRPLPANAPPQVLPRAVVESHKLLPAPN